MERINRISGHLGDIEDLGPKRKAESACSDTACNDCQKEDASVKPSQLQWNAIHANPVSAVSVFKTPEIDSASKYIQSLRNRHLKVFFMGKIVEEPVDHPAVFPSINAVAETYRLGESHPDLACADSSISGYKVSRFLHVTNSAQDVVMQSRMQRRLGQLTGTCFQRCVGMDAINSLFSITYEIDKKHSTGFHANLQNFLRTVHKQNGVIGGAMTDGKGDRSKRPSEQADLDLHLRVVERKVDGVIVRGAKTHQTGCVNSHWLVVMPGGALQEKEAQFAISFAVPVTAAGLVYIIGRQSCDLRSLETGFSADVDQGNAKYGGQEAVVVFNDVFVPYSAIFIDGQMEFCGPLVERFTAYHRRSYICKAGLGDVLIGAAATIADYNGAEKASHVKDKIVEMSHLNETLASCALAASFSSTKTPSGNWLPDVLMANVCKQNVTRFTYEIARLSQDIAGGLLVTLPSFHDFDNPETGGLLRKYFAATGGEKDVDKRRRILRLIENLTLGRNSVGYLTESMHGAGSPQAQRVVIARLNDVSGKKKLAKRLAGIVE